MQVGDEDEQHGDQRDQRDERRGLALVVGDAAETPVRPMPTEIALVIVSRAAKNKRPSRPMTTPLRLSETMRARTTIGAAPVIDGSTATRSSGVSASAMAIATKRRARTGTRGLEKPGTTRRQPPMRQNTMKAVRTRSGDGVTRSRPAP